VTGYARTFALFCVAATACSRSTAPPAAPPAAKVTAARVIARDVTEFDEFTGRLEPIHFVEIRPRVSGYIDSVHFVEGGLVRRGDLLFQIDPRPFQAEVDRLKAELASARATVERAESELQRAARLDPAHAISQEEHQRRVATARAASADVGAREAELRAAELNLEFTRVIAPIDGRVSRAIVTEGNLVSGGPGASTLLTTVVSVDPIYAAFDADEQSFLRYLSRSRQRQTPRGTESRGTESRATEPHATNGDARKANSPKAASAAVPVHLALASDRDFPRDGTLHFLDNRVDPATGTIRVRGIFRNADRSLTPGLFVRLRLPGGATHRGLLIQDQAIGTDLDKRFVFVVNKDHVAEYREVTTGPLIDGLRLVRAGLRPDDLVVVNGLQRIRPGARVDTNIIAMEAPRTTADASPTQANAPQPEQ
jgi:multidrug efflux system membrane fusion protein